MIINYEHNMEIGERLIITLKYDNNTSGEDKLDYIGKMFKVRKDLNKRYPKRHYSIDIDPILNKIEVYPENRAFERMFSYKGDEILNHLKRKYL